MKLLLILKYFLVGGLIGLVTGVLSMYAWIGDRLGSGFEMWPIFGGICGLMVGLVLAFIALSIKNYRDHPQTE